MYIICVNVTVTGCRGEHCSSVENPLGFSTKQLMNYFEDVYDVKHIYFLKKPINFDRLKSAINKAYSEYIRFANRFIHIKLNRYNKNRSYKGSIF